ncbi:MAG: hypothetical protein ACRC8K_08130 [Waterburya sp.]
MSEKRATSKLPLFHSLRAIAPVFCCRCDRFSHQMTYSDRFFTSALI